MPTAPKTLAKHIKIVEVYSENVCTEFQRIHAALRRYPIVSMDTEFPGVIFKPPQDYKHHKQTPFEYYEVMKKNVDALKLIQVGLTLSDSQGNLPDFGIWQFNLSDFDVAKDACAPDSIELLKKQGINFEKNRREGIHSKVFVGLLLHYGIVCDHNAADQLLSQETFYNYSVNWITFHSGYNFGYLIKLLIHPNPLPTRLEDFMLLVNHFFGTRVYDIKHMMKFCKGLFGGLERVSKVLGVEREVGICHQAGSDSYLTMKTFVKMYAKYFHNQDIHRIYGGAIHDLAFHKDVPIRSDYEAVLPIRRNFELNTYPLPYNCQLYINKFPVYLI